MDLKIDKFSPSALEQIAKIIGECYNGSGITSFFGKCGFHQYVHNGETKWRFVNSVLIQLQDDSYGTYNIVKILSQLCNPQEYFNNGESFRKTIVAVNEVISFYGLEFSGEGKMLQLSQSRTKPSEHQSEDLKFFSSRCFHPSVEKHSRDLFIGGNYYHAVFEVCKAFDKTVREKSSFDKHGTELMSSALSLKGTLKLNKQITETEKNEQEGLMHLCMGLMRAIRNPESHEPKLDWNITREDALDILSLLSYLYRQIDKTTYFNASAY